ncbi:MAG: DUF3488 and DUF4129 domain-containing transglutaminase family protein [Pyrinomonadaceae bacterium]
MSFDTFFRLVSYAAVFCGFFSLWVSGSFGVVGSGLFIAVMAIAWFIEGTRWQIAEKPGTALIVLALPVYFLIFKLGSFGSYGSEMFAPGILARMILTLSAIKLLQNKSDRDWIFLYLMAFFEVLLAAGLSISALYMGGFLAYLFVMVCAVIAFEMRRTRRTVTNKLNLAKSADAKTAENATPVLCIRRLPLTAVALIFFIVILAMPLFFVLPRVGEAGFGGDRTGLDTFSGFSDTVTLGNIGRIQESDAIVMRVESEDTAEPTQQLYFRGVALDTFDNRSWTKSSRQSKQLEKREGEWLRVDGPTSPAAHLSQQTIYMEPMDSPVLFGLPRVIGLQGNFPALKQDAYGSLYFQPGYERISYKVASDRSLPPETQLRMDQQPYTATISNYRDLPAVYDLRIAQLADQIAGRLENRYDKARAVESYLQTNFGYTLERKATGPEPLADFLFNIREGHCEYFATAMALMLRTQGIATRIVNGFHGGEYNNTAGVTIVRQRNAHSWVEVYFPKDNVWVPFDPTPFGGEAGMPQAADAMASLNRFVEALETFWIQYFVAFDNQEQRSLARSVRSGFMNYQSRISSYINTAQYSLTNWWSEVKGDRGNGARWSTIGYTAAYAVGVGLGVLVIIWIYRGLKRTTWFRFWKGWVVGHPTSIVEFYERMQRSLLERGYRREPHQTPLEFAYAVDIAEVLAITERYNGVRFGERNLSDDEAAEMEQWLSRLEAGPVR